MKHRFYFLCREVPGLTSIHTLFVLEHNRIAKMLRAAGITEEDDKIYEVTRRYYDLLKLDQEPRRNIIYNCLPFD